MPFLSISGTAVPVEDASGGTPDVVGEATRSFGGVMRNSRRIQKRVWSFKTTALDSPTGTTLENLVGGGSILLCTGDALRGVSVSCLVTLSVPKNVALGVTAGDGNNFLWQYDIQLQEA